MLKSVLKSQKISGSLDNLYINNKKENIRKIGINTLYLISCDLQRLYKGFIRPKKHN